MEVICLYSGCVTAMIFFIFYSAIDYLVAGSCQLEWCPYFEENCEQNQQISTPVTALISLQEFMKTAQMVESREEEKKENLKITT